MKGNIYYAVFFALVLLVFLLATEPAATFATTTTTTTTTEPTQLQGTMNQTQTTQEESVRVAVAEGSNDTVQYYTFTPQTVEINAGESVTWFSPAEFSELHTVTFVLDQNLTSGIILPFAVSGETDFELLPPFNVGEPLMIQAPDGREAIVALNKHTWYPAVLDANNQTTYLNGTDIQYTMDGTEKAINSGIIQPSMPPVGATMNETTTTNNATTTTTTDVTTERESEETPQATEEGQQPPLEEPSFPFPLVSSFTVTFEQPGTYPYFCALHPWMTGEVVVTGGGGGANQTGTEAGNQTGTQ